MSDRITCNVCGTSLKHSSMRNHRKSTKHIRLLANITSRPIPVQVTERKTTTEPVPNIVQVIKEPDVEENEECSICYGTTHELHITECGHSACVMCIKRISTCHMCRKNLYHRLKTSVERKMARFITQIETSSNNILSTNPLTEEQTDYISRAERSYKIILGLIHNTSSRDSTDLDILRGNRTLARTIYETFIFESIRKLTVHTTTCRDTGCNCGGELNDCTIQRDGLYLTFIYPGLRVKSKLIEWSPTDQVQGELLV